tara:strand:- start:320 stop:907 length:588 start_codon:yes stop_codon:yes gene_type:complete
MSYDHRKVIDALISDCDVKKGDLFVDLGANLGQELEVLAPMGVEVHSFEPHPELFKVLETTYGPFPNVTLNEAAAWTADDYRCLFFKNSKNQVNGGASLVEEKTNISTSLNEKVRCVDIAKYISNLDKPVKVLKIDVEGAEYDLIEHLLSTDVLDMVEFVYCEDHSRKCIHPLWREKKNRVLLELDSRGITLHPW